MVFSKDSQPNYGQRSPRMFGEGVSTAVEALRAIGEPWPLFAPLTRSDDNYSNEEMNNQSHPDGTTTS